MRAFNQDLHQEKADMNMKFSQNVIGIDHLALAVPDLQRAVEWTQNLLGCTVIETRETTSKHSGMISAVVRLGGLNLVLVQGTGTNSQVTQFIEKHGPGVQYVALRVNDIDQAIAALTERGMAFSTPPFGWGKAHSNFYVAQSGHWPDGRVDRAAQ